MNTKNDQVHVIKANGLSKRDKAVMDKAQKKQRAYKKMTSSSKAVGRPKAKELTVSPKETRLS